MLKKKSFPPISKTIFLTTIKIISLMGCGNITVKNLQTEEPVAVMITGVHHMGSNFNISEFYIDNNYGSNVGRGGGGGSFVCCVALPRHWKPGMIAKVRWSVNDWSNAVISEIEAYNYKSLKFSHYVAIVPIEKYDEPAGLYAHFFPGGKVRLVSSRDAITSPNHPVHDNDPAATELATQGTAIKNAIDVVKAASQSGGGARNEI